MNRKLQSSEWVLVTSLLVIMASLLLVAKVNAHRANRSLARVEFRKEEILVTIAGAVAKPGTYRAIPGSSVEEILRKARPKPFANLEALPLKEKIEAPLNLTVEELTQITVTLQGAVLEPVQLTLPVKSRICDLKSKASLSPDADLTFFRRHRLLKNGEILEVPRKRVD